MKTLSLLTVLLALIFTGCEAAATDPAVASSNSKHTLGDTGVHVSAAADVGGAVVAR